MWCSTTWQRPVRSLIGLSNDGLAAASFMTCAVTAHHQKVNDNVIECFAAISIGFIISGFHI